MDWNFTKNHFNLPIQSVLLLLKELRQNVRNYLSFPLKPTIASSQYFPNFHNFAQNHANKSWKEFFFLNFWIMYFHLIHEWGDSIFLMWWKPRSTFKLSFCIRGFELETFCQPKRTVRNPHFWISQQLLWLLGCCEIHNGFYLNTAFSLVERKIRGLQLLLCSLFCKGFETVFL